MGRIKRIGTRTGAVISAVALAAGAATALPSAAGAAGGEQGELGIRGVGTVYAAPGAVPILVTTAGAVSTFTFEVVNTGSTVSQYNLRAAVAFESCDPTGCPVPALAIAAGSTIITPSATGANGYFTAPIAPGKAAVYTLKLTVPKTAVPDNLYEAEINLSDTAGNSLSTEFAVVEVKTTTGSTAFDQFLNGAGQSPVRAPGSSFSRGVGVSSTTIAVGQTATYTVKLQNDTPIPGAIGYQLTDSSGCASAYSISVLAGTANVTTQALAGTYETPVLAQGKSTTLTIKLKLVTSPRPCQTQGNDQWYSVSSNGNNVATAIVVVNFALGT